MYVKLHEHYENDPRAREAAELTGACVHCGFCLTTCPTYQDSRDERDSPRGRIYLIKHMLESGSAGDQTRLHLDRCLTCRNCETACPSGMRYGELLDTGRELIEEQAPRSFPENTVRKLLRILFSSSTLLTLFLGAGRLVRPLLPKALQEKVPQGQKVPPRPDTARERRVLMLEGCVQQAATPATNASAARVLDKLGISLVAAPGAGCCGALDFHLSAQEAALERMRRNIDAWWPPIEQGAEALISSATGCGAMIADYGRLLQDDTAYAEKAARISKLHRDISEILLEEDLEKLQPAATGAVAVHTPCSMQHGLKKPGLIEDILSRTGFDIVEHGGKVLCCGSAGSYSLLQADISQRVREDALGNLTAQNPALIATGNVGCQLHLDSAADIPVMHWIELLDS